MSRPSSMCLLGALLLGGLLAAGVVFMGLRPEVRGGHQPQPDDRATAAKRDPVNPRAQRAASAKSPKVFSSDDLVAIYERDGAEAALAAAKSMTGSDRTSQVLFILTYLARDDPEFVAGALGDAGLDTTRQGFVVNAVMSHWKDAGKALAWAQTEFTGALRKTAVSKALGIMVRTDPAGAIAHLDAMPPSASRQSALAGICTSWGAHDPQAALAFLDGDWSAGDKANAIRWVVGSWARSHPEDAAAWVERVEDENLRAGLVQAVVQGWRTDAPDDAAAWVASLPDGPAKEAGLEALAQTRIGSDHSDPPPLPDVAWKQKAVADMKAEDFRNWAQQDPASATEFLLRSEGSAELIEMAVSLAAMRSTQEGPGATFEWAAGIPEEAGQRARRLAVIAWTRTDPAAAARNVEAVEPEHREPLSVALAENWTLEDPTAAAAWVAGFEGAEQSRLVKEVLEEWAGLEPRAAYEWLGSLPAGEARDAGIVYLIARESSQNLDAVGPWLELIAQPDLRERKRREHEWRLEADRKLADPGDGGTATGGRE